MSIAAKHLDPLVGLDTHITLVPTPTGPVPTPLPYPYVGMIFDVMDYVPVLGTKVFINGLPRAQAGTGGQAMPPHLPLAGPFAKPPTNESEVFMGSSTVLVEGEPQSYFGLPALSCQDIGMPAPPRVKRKSTPKSLLLPTTTVLSIPMGSPVLIGGAPTISMAKLGKAIAMGGLKKLAKLGPIERRLKAVTERLQNRATKLADKLGLGDIARNRITAPCARSRVIPWTWPPARCLRTPSISSCPVHCRSAGARLVQHLELPRPARPRLAPQLRRGLARRRRGALAASRRRPLHLAAEARRN